MIYMDFWTVRCVVIFLIGYILINIGLYLEECIVSSIELIRSLAIGSKPDIQDYLNCGYINKQIRDVLDEELNADVDFVIGGIWQSRAKREEHAFVRIRNHSVESVNKPIIVDGSIKQFCYLNEDDLWVVLGPKETLPEVAVLTGKENNDWYEMFSDQRPN